jgi:FkbM family methyltransferase
VNFKRLTTNLSLNAFKNIKPHNTGAGKKACTQLIYTVSEGNLGMNRILTKADPFMVGREITLTTLDQFTDELQISKVDLIKIDTEGFEMNVLEGARKTIEQFSPTFFIEIDDQNLKQQGSGAAELIQFLNDFNYSCRYAETGLKITPLQNHLNCHFDLIASREEIG